MAACDDVLQRLLGLPADNEGASAGLGGSDGAGVPSRLSFSALLLLRLLDRLGKKKPGGCGEDLGIRGEYERFLPYKRNSKSCPPKRRSRTAKQEDAIAKVAFLARRWLKYTP